MHKAQYSSFNIATSENFSKIKNKKRKENLKNYKSYKNTVDKKVLGLSFTSLNQISEP